VSALLTLKALVDLQAVDVRIRDLEKDRQQIPSRLQTFESSLGAKRAELNEAQNQMDEPQLNRRMLESDLRAEKEKIKKWESRLNELKNNRDYQALSREIEAARKANLGIEDEILKRMQEIEDLKVVIAQKQADLEQIDRQYQSERVGLEERLASLNATLAEERKVRDTAKASVSDRWLAGYDNIRKRRDGTAVVAVVDEHCQGCHMGIPPQLYNTVLTGQSIETCPFCHRILFYQQALDELTAK
jgi:predicted  nucleic acid-binding Zn-ribbon protein